MQEPLFGKLLRWMTYAVAFMPLIIFSQYISPFHFGKVVIFRSIVQVMLPLYLVLLLSDRSYKPRTNLIFWAFLAFVLAFTLTTITSVQPYSSFWGSLERMGGLFTFWHYFVFFVIVTAVFRKQEHWETFLNLTIFTAILSALYGFGQKTNIEFFIGSGGRERIFGTIGNAALFAGYEIVNVFLALTLLLRPANAGWKKILYGTALGLGTLAIIMTVVRGSLIGLGVGFSMFAVWYFLKTHSPNAKRAILALVTLAALFLVILVTPVKQSPLVKNSRFLKRVTDTSFSSFTAKTRFWAWQAGIEGWSESPSKMLVGWGPENFNIPFSKHFNPKFFNGYGSETLFDRAHNMFVEILVTMGLAGFLTYLAMLIAAFVVLRRIERAQPAQGGLYRIGLSSLIVAYAIHNSFIFDTSANFLVFFSVLGFISFLHLRGTQIDATLAPKPTQVPGPVRLFTAAGLLVVALVAVYRTNVLPSKANYASTRGIIQGWAGSFAEAAAKFREAMQYNVPGKYEIRHRYAQYVLEYAGDRDQAKTPGLQGELQFAIQEVIKNRDENLHDYLPELYLSRLNIVLGRDDPKSPYNDVALVHSMRALEISPTFVRTYYEVGQAYLNKKEYDNAMVWFKKASELNPDVGVSFWYWGIVEMTKGNTEEGLRIINRALQKGYAPSENDYLRLADTYAQRKEYGPLAAIYERLIAQNPKSASYHASLAVTYANLGRIDEAIAMARKAAEIDPSYLQEAQAFARQLGRTL